MPSAYNRWIGMLSGAFEGDWADLLLEGTPISAGEYLMHLDAAIAFLKEHLAATV